ncbi:MAG TPA: hypothetical protein VH092_20965 [Urbifossiella sp.]|jgi:hypothetical protein|nr:hypothetical protein [Urbifossiella sp.]
MAVMAKNSTKTAGETDGEGNEWITRSIRFPPALYAKLEADAKKERRSTQLQIIWMIEEAYRLRDQDK